MFSSIIKNLLDNAPKEPLTFQKFNYCRDLIYLNQLEELTTVLDEDARLINYPGPGEDTLLIIATRAGSLEAAKILIKRQANVNAKNVNGTTALLEAAFARHHPLVRTLLKHGADPTVATSEQGTQSTALLYVARTMQGSLALTKLIVDYARRRDLNGVVNFIVDRTHHRAILDYVLNEDIRQHLVENGPFNLFSSILPFFKNLNFYLQEQKVERICTLQNLRKQKQPK